VNVAKGRFSEADQSSTTLGGQAFGRGRVNRVVGRGRFDRGMLRRALEHGSCHTQ
jgi:hypothetical protein